MPVFVLSLAAETEGISAIESLGEEMQYTVDFQQSGGSEVKSGVVVSLDETIDPGNGATECHALLKWGGKTQSTIVMMEIPGVTRAFGEADSGNEPVPLIAMECRGCEPIAWQVGEGWKVTAASGQVFEDVDLSEDWTEFDEGASLFGPFLGHFFGSLSAHFLSEQVRASR